MFRSIIVKILSVVFVVLISTNIVFAEQLIKKIRILGNNRVSSVAVEASISYREGDEIGKEEEKEIIQELYNTGSFKDVNVKFDNGILTIKVVENPIFNNFIFKGNKAAKSSELLNVVGIKIRSVYSKRSERLAIENIRQYYKARGYYSAKINLEKEIKTNNRLDLIFNIEEGEIATIKKISFIGNKAYSDTTLKGHILSSEDVWWRFLSDDDIYDKARTDVDKQSLRQFYTNRGYSDIEVISVNAELSKNKKDFFLTYKINEGQRYKLGKLYITGWKSGINKNKVNKLLTGADKSGYVYAGGFSKIIYNVSEELARQGVAFVTLEPEFKKYTKDGQRYMDVNFKMKTNRKVFIEKIVIRGNTRTLDRVIRKKILLVEGDPFNPVLMRSSEENIEKLGYFSGVKLSFAEGTSSNKVIIYIDVDEKTTGSAGFGAGYSSANGVIFRASISEDNFLGRGQKLSSALTKQGKNLSGNISFTEPYFMGYNVSSTFSVSRSIFDHIEKQSYKATSNSFATSFSYDFNEKWAQTIGYSFHDFNLYKVGANASLSALDEQGRTKGHTVSQKLSYTDVDDVLDPSSGYKFSLTTYIKSMATKYRHSYVSLRGSYYYPVDERINLILFGTATRIMNYENLRLNDRLYLNSDYIIGFDKVGPIDQTSRSLLGGTTRLTGSVELDFPIGLPASMGVKGNAFYNIAKLTGTPRKASVNRKNADGTNALDSNGNEIMITQPVVGENEVRQTIGLGVKWESPIGPMRFTVSRPIKKAPTDKSSGFQFIVGFGMNY